MKKSIEDSGNQISKLNVVLMARDAALSLTQTFELFECWQSMYDCDFNYIFVEDGSKDNTRELLQSFVDEHQGNLVSPQNTKMFEHMPRTMRIANARNASIEYIDSTASWTVVIDTDVLCKPSILEALFAHNPMQQNIGLMGAYGLEIFPHEGSVVEEGHYYDTFAFTQKNFLSNNEIALSLHWPLCVFENCARCDHYRDKASQPIERGGLFEVGSAFGGLALISTEALLTEGVVWSSKEIPQLASEGSYSCEHILFCRAIERQTGKLIVIATDCEVYWHTDDCLPRYQNELKKWGLNLFGEQSTKGKSYGKS